MSTVTALASSAATSFAPVSSAPSHTINGTLATIAPTATVPALPSLDALSDHDEAIAESLTELETQVTAARDQLGPRAAEIDIDDSTTDDGADESGNADRERFGGDEWAVDVPNTVMSLQTREQQLSQTIEANAAAFAVYNTTNHAPPTTARPIATAPVLQMWPEWPAPDYVPRDWTTLFTPTWSAYDDFRSFGQQRRLIGPPNVAFVTAATSIAALLVLSIWALARRSQRRRTAERQTQWAASVELLDAFPHYDDMRV